MLAFNIFKWIGDLFTNVLFVPFKWLRLDVALEQGGWWTSNAINWIFVFILFILLGYWISQSFKFKKEGTEDRV